MRKRILFLLLFFASLCFFCMQTIQAFGVITFHSEFFENKKTIVIDAGHGGEDGGAVGINGALEKDINLSIALQLAENLKQNNFQVVLTRESDCSIGDSTLQTIAERKRSDTRKRLEITENVGECILVSIHQNQFSQSQYSGAQIFYSTNRTESARLAESIRQNIVSSLQPENKRKNKPAESNIYLMYHCRMPAVLVECGFLSNPQEADQLLDERYQKDMAAAIYNGIIDYFQAEAAESE